MAIAIALKIEDKRNKNKVKWHPTKKNNTTRVVRKVGLVVMIKETLIKKDLFTTVSRCKVQTSLEHDGATSLLTSSIHAPSTLLLFL